VCNVPGRLIRNGAFLGGGWPTLAVSPLASAQNAVPRVGVPTPAELSVVTLVAEGLTTYADSPAPVHHHRHGQGARPQRLLRQLAIHRRSDLARPGHERAHPD